MSQQPLLALAMCDVRQSTGAMPGHSSSGCLMQWGQLKLEPRCSCHCACTSGFWARRHGNCVLEGACCTARSPELACSKNDRDLLMCMASLATLPSAPVFVYRSLPARSTRLSLLEKE